jgi:ABC-type phosphate transport system substrate-binding protein
MKCRQVLTSIGLAIALMTASAASVRAGDFQIIVHASNPVSSLSERQVSRMLLKKTKSWDHGGTVLPVDQGSASRTRARFSKSLLGKSISSVKAYWQQQIFSGRGVPPPEMESEEAVVAFVRRNPSAIGYVGAGVSLNGVKSIRVER